MKMKKKKKSKKKKKTAKSDARTRQLAEVRRTLQSTLPFLASSRSYSRCGL